MLPGNSLLPYKYHSDAQCKSLNSVNQESMSLKDETCHMSINAFNQPTHYSVYTAAQYFIIYL